MLLLYTGEASCEGMHISILRILLQQFVIVFTVVRKTIVNITDALLG
jgi:hypothetical protein